MSAIGHGKDIMGYLKKFVKLRILKKIFWYKVFGKIEGKYFFDARIKSCEEQNDTAISLDRFTSFEMMPIYVRPVFRDGT